MLKTKGIVSTILIITFTITALTGIIRFLDLNLGIKGNTIKEIHEIAGLLMVLTTLLHFFLNRKIYKTEINAWKKTKA